MAGTRQRNYQQGKIYELKCLTSGKVYIGSTTKKYLSQRLVHHKSSFKRWRDGIDNKYCTSYIVLEGENYEIHLLELYPCNSCDELHTRERHYIEQVDCVNRNVPTRTCKEYYDDNRDKILEYQQEYRSTHKSLIQERDRRYRHSHKEEISAKKQEYRNLHAEEIRIKKADYYERNSDRLKARAIQYRLENNDQINSWKKEKIQCPCGVVTDRGHKSRHEQTQHHKKWILTQAEAIAS